MPAGRSSTTRWTKVPPGASGSSTTTATVGAPCRSPDQASSGTRPAPAQVYAAGMVPPSVNAGLVTVRPGAADGGGVRGRLLVVHPAAASATPRAKTGAALMRAILD